MIRTMLDKINIPILGDIIMDSEGSHYIFNGRVWEDAVLGQDSSHNINVGEKT